MPTFATPLCSHSSPKLPDAIEAAIGTPGRLWFPGLAEGLVAGLSGSARVGGWDRGNYTTERWLRADRAAPCAEAPAIAVGAFECRIERPSEVVKAAVPGLSLARAPAFAIGMITDAVGLLRLAGVDNEVGSLAWAIHVLDAEAGYDVSHSDPSVPFSMFVSAPREGETDGAIRLAESMIHEAMHLQLTLIECVLPLISDDASQSYSPWQGRMRPLQGILHGAYVFAVIRQVLDRLTQVDAAHRSYAVRRSGEIAEEATALGDINEGLTSLGQKLWARARCAIH